MRKKIKKFRRKKNSLILIVLFISGVLIAFYSLAHVYKFISIDLLNTIYLFVLLLYLFFVIQIKNKITYYNYQYNYLIMLQEDLPPIELTQILFDNNWKQKLTNKNFTLHEKTSEMELYYVFANRKNEYKQFGRAMICVVVNKEVDLELYDDKVQQSIKRIYEKNDKQTKVKNEIVIHFKTYETLDDKAKTEIQKIIAFKQDLFSITNITVGFIKDINKVYYLRPERRFPNKQYFLACQLIKELT